MASRRDIETIPGDTSGLDYSFPVYRFGGGEGPRAYIQAALHGGEFPGVAAIHFLLPMLRRAEAEGRLRGAITVVPWANPIGRGQYMYGAHQGRFHHGSRGNFNRDFPLLDRPDAPIPSSRDLSAPADVRLKRRLLELSMGADIVLDLHCDDESVAYLYVPVELWPAMADIAAAMDMDAVVLWGGGSGAAFDDASVHPYLASQADVSRLAVTTVEYRGLLDVSAELGEADAEGLYRVLVARGVIEDSGLPAPGPFKGVVGPIENVEMVKAERPGMLFFHVAPGEHVKAGDLLATVVAEPGEPDGVDRIVAPQAGYVFTRRKVRSVMGGEDVMKLIGEASSPTARGGALEA